MAGVISTFALTLVAECDAVIAPDTSNPAAVALSKLGASKGGRARAAVLSPSRRRAIARKAVQARWNKKR